MSVRFFLLGLHRPPTVNLVFFMCLDFREFVILGLYTKFRIRELSAWMIITLL